MSSRGFAFLLIVTVAAIMIAGSIAEHFTEPGLGRTLWVALGTALVLFPAARWAEKRGWVQGKLQLGNIKEEFIRKPTDTTNQTSENKKD